MLVCSIAAWGTACRSRGEPARPAEATVGSPPASDTSSSPTAATDPNVQGLGLQPATGAVCAAGAVGARSPVDTVRLLQSLHERRNYAAIAPLLVPERREGLIQLLKAVDEVLAANADLQKAAREKYCGPTLDSWDLSPMQNNLGPFSAQITLINQSFRGDGAVVTFQEGDNVPVAHAQFEWSTEGWQYRPEQTPAKMTTELLELAGVLRDLARAVEGGVSFDQCSEAFTRRVYPQMVKVTTATDETVAAAPEITEASP
jgi:hypothetical protein